MATPYDEQQRQTLATAAKRRRHELGLALNDVNAQQGGTSKKTWQRVEAGFSVHLTSYTKIDRLLQWATGGCVGIMEGRDPIPIRAATTDSTATIAAVDPEAMEKVDQQARERVQLVAVATTDLNAEQIRELSERIVEDFRKHGLI
ncbi:hypothetical protein [Streptomyces sp. NPDC047315]|uniref:hypothetical protein n=1 Tax=Streptomyces sp. NPDC047315 TaxID=3155142 RepID=UPI0033F32F6A